MKIKTKNKIKNKVNKSKNKLNKSKSKNKIHKNKTNKIKRGGMTLLYNQISKAALKMQLNVSLLFNTMSKRSISYENSLIDYSTAFNKYANTVLITKLKGLPINLTNIYNYYKDLIPNNEYDNDDRLIILIIFIYKFYSNKLVDKQYYSLWKNKNIEKPEEICEYKYILYEINDLWRNLSGINRMDDYEKIINEHIKKIKNDDIRPYINFIQNNEYTELNTETINIKKNFEDKIFNIPNPKCNDIKVNYSYYILVILYYIHYTISPNELKGNNFIDNINPIIYDDYITSKEDEYCSIEKSFIDAYNLSKAGKPNIKSLSKGLPKGLPKGLTMPKGLPAGLTMPKGLPKGLPEGLPKSLPAGLPKLPTSMALTNPIESITTKLGTSLLKP